MRERVFRLLASVTTFGFVGGLVIGIAGGILGNPIMLGIGVGVACFITLGCLCLRERNLND